MTFTWNNIALKHFKFDSKITALKIFFQKVTKLDGVSTGIGFHEVHDSNIVLLHNNSIARKMNGEDLHGTCFTNRNIRLGEKIYIRVIETHPKLSGSMDFGLTICDPEKIDRSPADHFHKLRKDKGSKLFRIRS